MTCSDGGSAPSSLLSRTLAWDEEFLTAAAFKCARSSEGLVVVLWQLQLPLLDPARRGDQDQQDPLGGERDHLHVPDRGVAQRRVLDDGHLLGHLGQQLDGPMEHVVKVESTREERLNGLLLGR